MQTDWARSFLLPTVFIIDALVGSALFGKLIESITHPKVAVASIDVAHGKVSDIRQLASVLLMGNIVLHHRHVYLQSSLMCLVAAALVSASDILRFWRIQFKSSDFSK